MSVSGTVGYWMRRERDERLAAERAGDAVARRIHLSMARGYRRRIEHAAA